MSSRLIVLSGPSGVGKGTVVRNILGRFPNFCVSVSATTRAPRVGEIDGREYFFVSEQEFDDMLKNDELLEHAVVHGKHKYGTPKKPVLDALAAGMSVILEIDVQGAFQVRKNYPDAVLVFINAPSFEELAARLAGRSSESTEEQAVRLATAKAEMEQANKFDFVLVNEKVSECADEVVKLASK